LAKSLEPNRDPRGAMKDRRVPVADDAVRLTVGPDPGHKYPEGWDSRPVPPRKGQEILKVRARVASRARKNQTRQGEGWDLGSALKTLTEIALTVPWHGHRVLLVEQLRHLDEQAACVSHGVQLSDYLDLHAHDDHSALLKPHH